MTLEEAEAKYGPIVDGVWADEVKWCSIFEVPVYFWTFWLLNGRPVQKIYCNKDFQPLLSASLQNIKERCLVTQLKTFDGCFQIRSVRGEPERQSAHSYGLAIDINAATNPLGEQGDISAELVKCFTDAGLTWGGTFHRLDPQHFSVGW